MDEIIPEEDIEEFCKEKGQIKDIRSFFCKFAQKIDIFDPLDRAILDDEGKNQAVSRE